MNKQDFSSRRTYISPYFFLESIYIVYFKTANSTILKDIGALEGKTTNKSSLLFFCNSIIWETTLGIIDISSAARAFNLKEKYSE